MIPSTRRAVLTCGLLGLAVGSIPTAGAQPPRVTPTADRMKGRGYALTVPSGWLAEKTTDDFASLYLNSKQQFEPTVNVTAERVKAAPSPKDLGDKLVQEGRASGGFQLLSEHAVSVGGVPGWEVDYQYRIGTPPRVEQAAQVMVVRTNIVYNFVYEALPTDFPAHAADFNAVLQSVRWNDRNLAAKVPSLASLIGRMTNQVYSEQVSLGGRYVATLAYRDGLTYGYEFLSLQPRARWHPLRPDDPLPKDEVAEMADEGIERDRLGGAAHAGRAVRQVSAQGVLRKARELLAQCSHRLGTQPTWAAHAD